MRALKLNPANERVKRDYFRFLKEAKGRDEATIDGAAAALRRFEETTGAKDFGKLHREQAIAFKRRLADAVNARTGEKLSKATMHSTLRHCRDFFIWLAREPGYRSRIAYSDADYFSPSERDKAVARGRREKRVPTLAQVEQVLAAMPADTIVQRRDRALFAFAMLTGARVGALATFRLGDVDIERGLVQQDARHVATKFGKTFPTWFVPASEAALAIVEAWHRELSADPARGPDSPLFPATALALDERGAFTPAGLSAEGWSGTGPVRQVFERAFAHAGQPYVNPHSFRDMLVHLGMSLNLTVEELKAWSQNLGHKDMMTTLTSYGQIPAHRQGELIRMIGTPSSRLAKRDQIATLEALLAGLKAGAVG